MNSTSQPLNSIRGALLMEVFNEAHNSLLTIELVLLFFYERNSNWAKDLDLGWRTCAGGNGWLPEGLPRRTHWLRKVVVAHYEWEEFAWSSPSFCPLQGVQLLPGQQREGKQGWGQAAYLRTSRVSFGSKILMSWASDRSFHIKTSACKVLQFFNPVMVTNSEWHLDPECEDCKIADFSGSETWVSATTFYV